MRKKILIVAKTYPTRSKKYTELVCTAGVDEEGSWYRIYPIPTKTLKEYEGLKKYTWIDAEITKDSSDSRPESYKINTSTLKLLNTIEPKENWRYRKDILLKSKVYHSLKEIISLANDSNELSLCLFKPSKFLRIYFEKKEKEVFSKEEIREYKNANLNLFEHGSSCEVEFNVMPQLPYSIKMVFEDTEGKESKMNILDWEISQLYWNLSRSNNEQETKAKIKNKLESLIDSPP